MSEDAAPKFPADVIVHWATGPVHCCLQHANALVALGKMLGSYVPVEPITMAPDNSGAECINCINEARANK